MRTLLMRHSFFLLPNPAKEIQRGLLSSHPEAT